MATKKAPLPYFSERTLKLAPGQIVECPFDLGGKAPGGYKATGGLKVIATDGQSAHVGNPSNKEKHGVLQAWTAKPAKDQAPTTAKGKTPDSNYSFGKKRRAIPSKEILKRMKAATLPEPPPTDSKKTTKKGSK